MIRVNGTIVSTNNAPEFANDTATRSFTETVGDATVTTAEDLGSPITATDTDGDTLTYTLGGLDAAKFDLDASSGQLATKVGESYDREAKASYSVTVTATDPDTDSDSITVTITVDNVTELPLVPGGLSAEVNTVNRSNVDVTWTSPINTGRPVLLTYDVRYRTDTGDWTSQSVPANKTFVTLTGLMAETSYNFQVRVKNLDGDGPWTDSHSHRTGIAATTPGAPTSFTATAGDGVVMLAWGPVNPQETGGARIEEFEYRHAVGTTVSESTDWVSIPDGSDSDSSPINETSFTVSNLTNDTEYAFELRAVNAVGGGTTAGPVTATPAAACAAPNFGTRRNFWTGAVTVEPIMSGGSTVAYGFSAISPTIGALDDKTFSIGSSNHEIDEIGVYHTGADDGDVDFSLKAALTTGEKAALRLHVCDAAFDFNAATLASTFQTYKFTADLDWSGVSSRTLYLSLPANNAATGKPEISGTATVGETLTAAKGNIADADGLPADDDDLMYQWVRVDGANEMDISAATSKTYTLVAADAGKKLKVKVDFTDNLSGEEARTSDATGTVTTPGTLVSNVGQSGSEITRSSNTRTAQSFSTGSNTGGYTLRSIDIPHVDSQHATFAVSVCSVDASDHPTTPCIALTPPISFAAATLSFTAPANTILAASTTYSVRIVVGSNNLDLGVTSSDLEDSGAAALWSIGNTEYWESSGDWFALSGNSAVRLAVKGSAASSTNNAPEFANDTATRSFTETVGDATVTTAEDLGAPTTATDADMDTLTYTLGGSDAAKFDLDASSGQLATKVGGKLRP